VELQPDSTTFTEIAQGPQRWVYRSWTNPGFWCVIERYVSEIGGMNQTYRIDTTGELPAHEMNVLAGKIISITNGGRE
jgi:hypothetical protein